MEETAQQNPFNADEFAAPVLAEVAAMDNESIGKELLRLGGVDFYAVPVYQDAFECMTPERLLGLYVLAQTLNDIEPLDDELSGHNLGGMKRDAYLRARREHRIAHHQKVEQELRMEGREILSQYRKLRRAPAAKREGNTNTKLRGLYERKVARFKARREDLDTCNTALEYVLRDRADIRLWCDVADVNVERFYRAVERRLLLKGRCSIELRGLLEEFRQGKDRSGPTRKDMLARYELRAFSGGN